jgi:hypothetical protein
MHTTLELLCGLLARAALLAGEALMPSPLITRLAQKTVTIAVEYNRKIRFINILFSPGL